MDRVHGPGSRVHSIGSYLGSSNPRSTIQILCTKRVSTHLILIVRARSDSGAVGSGQGQRGLMLTPARHGRAWQLTGVQVFSSHGGGFLMWFAPTGSQQRAELDLANLNRWRKATESSNGEAARPASSVDVCGLQRCPDAKNRGETFLATSSCP
jgi:hypothetical protein